MEEFENLEKSNQLKENGIIADKEFEIKEYKTLNSKGTHKRNISRYIFIMTIICFIISIVVYIYKKNYFSNDVAEALNNLPSIDSVSQSEFDYYEEILEEKEHIYSNIGNVVKVMGSITGALLVSGIIVKFVEKDKKGIDN